MLFLITSSSALSGYLQHSHHTSVLRYDNRAKDLTKEGMRRGTRQAATFLLFLSEGVLERPFCQFEIREAMSHTKPMLLDP
jgi:hypothetical protein